jgi:hypothetical protein
MIGLTKVLLLQTGGILMTLAAVAGAVVIFWVIDPKLRAVSGDYEARQAQYIEALERKLRWQDDGGAADAGGKGR